jgi:hypothetical protein
MLFYSVSHKALEGYDLSVFVNELDQKVKQINNDIYKLFHHHNHL